MECSSFPHYLRPLFIVSVWVVLGILASSLSLPIFSATLTLSSPVDNAVYIIPNNGDSTYIDIAYAYESQPKDTSEHEFCFEVMETKSGQTYPEHCSLIGETPLSAKQNKLTVHSIPPGYYILHARLRRHSDNADATLKSPSSSALGIPVVNEVTRSFQVLRFRDAAPKFVLELQALELVADPITNEAPELSLQYSLSESLLPHSQFVVCIRLVRISVPVTSHGLRSSEPAGSSKPHMDIMRSCFSTMETVLAIGNIVVGTYQLYFTLRDIVNSARADPDIVLPPDFSLSHSESGSNRILTASSNTAQPLLGSQPGTGTDTGSNRKPTEAEEALAAQAQVEVEGSEVAIHIEVEPLSAVLPSIVLRHPNGQAVHAGESLEFVANPAHPRHTGHQEHTRHAERAGELSDYASSNSGAAEVSIGYDLAGASLTDSRSSASVAAATHLVQTCMTVRRSISVEGAGNRHAGASASAGGGVGDPSKAMLELLPPTCLPTEHRTVTLRGVPAGSYTAQFYLQPLGVPAVANAPNTTLSHFEHKQQQHQHNQQQQLWFPSSLREVQLEVRLPVEFVPSYDWQLLHIWHTIPSGIETR